MGASVEVAAHARPRAGFGWAHATLWSGVAGTALVLWPGAASTFHQPKAWGLFAAAVFGAARLLWTRERPDRLAFGVALAWAVSVGVSALVGAAPTPAGLLLEAAGALWLLACVGNAPDPRAVVRAGAVVGSIVAAVAFAQALGLDPLRLAGWVPDHPGERMRVYGTLGNPDFVAAYLGASVWLVAAEWRSSPALRPRAAWLVAVALHLAALYATRSFASLLALGAGAVWVALRLRGKGSPRTWLLGGAVFVVVLTTLALGTRGRSLSSALEGRGYLLRVASPHLLDEPLLGAGPGSFVLRWAEWERQHWARGGSDEGDRRFAAAQDHAHADYLEWALTLGMAGVLVRLAVLGLALRRSARVLASAGSIAPGAALVALAARALVDFPFHRPAELCLALVLTATCLRCRP